MQNTLVTHTKKNFKLKVFSENILLKIPLVMNKSNIFYTV